MGNIVKCKICGADASFWNNFLVLNKHSVKYYRCNECDFIQTEEPYWINEAYSNAITKTDIGLISRNIFLKKVVKSFLLVNFKEYNRLLDYGGGYGMLVRMMRDNGFNFYRQDTYCENLFAKKFDLTDIATVKKFDLVTAFEVFEHFVNPIEEIQKILDLGDDILFSTELQPSLGINNWEYLSLNTGQHVSLWSLKSLNKVADKFHLKLYSDGKSLHYLTRNKKINEFAFRISINSKVANIVDLLINRRNTLQKSDHEFLIKNSFEI